MPTRQKAPLLLGLGAVALLAIGAAFWFMRMPAPEPGCSLAETHRTTAPDGRYDLVVGARDCGLNDISLEAFLVAPGEAITPESESFAAIGRNAGLEPRWDAQGRIELTLPPDSEIYELAETVAGIEVIYR